MRFHLKTTIIYEDTHIIVCHKPAGFPTQSGRISQADVISELKNHIGNQLKSMAEAKEPYLGIIHRLDQPVEGLLIFAKTKTAAAALTKQLENHTLHKHYYAAICGKPMENEVTLVNYLKKDSQRNLAIITSKDDTGAKPANLTFHVMSNAPVRQDAFAVFPFTHPDISILDITIQTGRFHQIRAQLSHAGLPILGDQKYGTPESLQLSKTLCIRNVCLVAYVLEFIHPVSGKNMKFSL